MAFLKCACSLPPNWQRKGGEGDDAVEILPELKWFFQGVADADIAGRRNDGGNAKPVIRKGGFRQKKAAWSAATGARPSRLRQQAHIGQLGRDSLGVPRWHDAALPDREKAMV